MARRKSKRSPSSAGGRRRAPSLPHEERRAQIVHAAIPLLAERSGAVPTAEIARAAGVAEGTIFRAFGDKDSLLEACLHRALDPAEAVEAISEASGRDTLDERVRGAVDATMGHFRTALPLMHGTLRRDAPRAQAGRAVAGMFHGLLNATTELFAKEVVRGEVTGDPIALARIVVGACQSTVWLELWSGGWSVDPAQAVTVLLDGCRARR